MSGMEFHPLAEIFPLIDDAGLKELADDIRENGLRQAIVTHEGKILDSRNRYEACRIAGVDLRFKDEGANPLGYVTSLNLRRRHLDESQRAMAAARIANLKHGGDRMSEQGANWPPEQPPHKVPIAVAAALLNVSPRSVKRARQVLAHGSPIIIASVEQGKTSVSRAAVSLTKPADKYFSEQEARLGPVEAPAEAPAPPRTIPRKVSLDVVNALKAHRAALVNWTRQHRENNIPDCMQAWEATITLIDYTYLRPAGIVLPR